MNFSDSAWGAIESIYKSILEHPFNQELAQGTLAKERFQFYMKQDSLYLLDFARALAITASRATDPDDLVLLLDFSKGDSSIHQRRNSIGLLDLSDQLHFGKVHWI